MTAREVVVMKRGEATMNVPADKVQSWLDEGWIEISRYVVEEPTVSASKPDTESDSKKKK